MLAARTLLGVILSLAPTLACAQAEQNGLRALDVLAGGLRA
jgi:hypothetical protein